MRIIPAQEFGVAILPVIRHRDFEDRAAPAARASPAAIKRGGVLDMSGDGILPVGNVLHPFAVQAPNVQRQHGCRSRHLSVAGVAQPLPVGAVGGDAAVQVGELGTQVGMIQPVEGFV